MENKQPAQERRTEPSPIPTPKPQSIEIHISSCCAAWTPAVAKKVRDIGGRYNHCRGYSTERIVVVPNTNVGRDIADKCIRSRPTWQKAVTVIFRGLPGVRIAGDASAPTVVHRVASMDDADVSFDRAFQHAVAQGHVVDTAKEAAEQQEVMAKRRADNMTRRVKSFGYIDEHGNLVECEKTQARRAFDEGCQVFQLVGVCCETEIMDIKDEA